LVKVKRQATLACHNTGMWNGPLVDMAGLPYIGLKKKGTPIYGSPSSNKARAAASRVRWAQLISTFLAMEKEILAIHESLFILHKCNYTINRIWALLDRFKENKQMVYDYGNVLSNYIKMELLSFMDEYHNYFNNKSENDYSKRISEIKAICKPVVKRINRWRGLNKFRNDIIAHTWRADGKLVLPDRSKYDVPKNLVEIKILVDLNNYLWGLINAEFEKETAFALNHFVNLKQTESKMTDVTKINQEMISMAEEVDVLCQKYGKAFYIKVDQYVIED